MNEYEAKQERKKERLEGYADKLEREAEALQGNARTMADVIPFGQPILVGHHSERRDRNYRNRIHNKFQKAHETHQRADEIRQKAARVGKGGISSDDPDAVDKLKGKLEKMEAEREMMKRVNRQHKKGGWAAVEGISDEMREHFQHEMDRTPWAGNKPFPSWRLTNLGGNIKRVKERIAELETRQDMPEAQDIEGDGLTIHEAAEDNRIHVTFDEKPPRETCQLMRQHGFKWSPTRGAWVRQLNNAGRAAAQSVAEKLNGT